MPAPSPLDAVRAAREGTLDAARPEAVAKRHAQGRLTAREGIDAFLDAGSFVEIGRVAKPARDDMAGDADGGVVGSKPYVSSGAYIDRMSDYCRGCAYDVKAKEGEGACPFNLLYWHFLDRHRARFQGNPRMAQMYRTWDGMEAGRRARVLAEGGAWLARLDAGEAV